VDLQVLGSGFEVFSVGKKKLVRSVPTELNKDHNGILELAQVCAFDTILRYKHISSHIPYRHILYWKSQMSVQKIWPFRQLYFRQARHRLIGAFKLRTCINCNLYHNTILLYFQHHPHALMQARGYVTIDQVKKEFSWSSGRAIDALETLMKVNTSFVSSLQ
jgi:hypothetical protein